MKKKHKQNNKKRKLQATGNIKILAKTMEVTQDNKSTSNLLTTPKWGEIKGNL